MPRQLVDRWDEREWRRRDSRRRLLDRFRPTENTPTEAVTTPATWADTAYVQFLTTDPMWPGNAPQTTTPADWGFHYGTTPTTFVQSAWLDPQTVTAANSYHWGTPISPWTATTMVTDFFQSTSNQPRVETPREAAERRRRALISRNRTRAHILRRRIASRRARVLLLSSLTPGQRGMYEREGRFLVRSQHGRLYEVRQGYSGNVYLLAEGPQRSAVTAYCAHGDIPMPDEDHMLAQKLMLESDEDGFLAMANATHLLRGPDSRGNIAA